MKTILFQGDSITDSGRSRETDFNRGYGYPSLVSSELTYTYPNKYITYNRGISGDRVVDLYARVKTDFIDMKPDILSILIGINDVAHKVNPNRYYDVYSMLIEDVKEALPDVKIMIMEPFVLEGVDTQADFGNIYSKLRIIANKARGIAEENNLTFIPLQDKFEDAAKLAPTAYWLRDGVHATPAGHELIKREWLKAFAKL